MCTHILDNFTIWGLSFDLYRAEVDQLEPSPGSYRLVGRLGQGPSGTGKTTSFNILVEYMGICLLFLESVLFETSLITSFRILAKSF